MIMSKLVRHLDELRDLLAACFENIPPLSDAVLLGFFSTGGVNEHLE